MVAFRSSFALDLDGAVDHFEGHPWYGHLGSRDVRRGRFAAVQVDAHPRSPARDDREAVATARSSNASTLRSRPSKRAPRVCPFRYLAWMPSRMTAILKSAKTRYQSKSSISMPRAAEYRWTTWLRVGKPGSAMAPAVMG